MYSVVRLKELRKSTQHRGSSSGRGVALAPDLGEAEAAVEVRAAVAGADHPVLLVDQRQTPAPDRGLCCQLEPGGWQEAGVGRPLSTPQAPPVNSPCFCVFFFKRNSYK